MTELAIEQTSMRVADWIIDALFKLGVRTAFMVTGGGAMHLNDAIGVYEGFEVVCTLHEQGASIASEAYAKQTGAPAVCLVTSGPGGTNAITGVTGAWLDSVPMVVISGQAKRSDLVGSIGVRQRGVQEVDIVSMVKAVTKMAVTVMDPYDICFYLEQAVHLATTGRPGPVWLDIPLDVQGAIVDTTLLRHFEVPPKIEGAASGDLGELLSEVIERLRLARRPILLFGAGIWIARAQNDAVRLAEALGVPTLATWPAQGIIGDEHPLCAGRPGVFAPRGANFALQNSDFLLCLGARLDLVTTGYNPKDFARNAFKIVVDIDPNELNKLEGAVQLAFLGDVKLTISALLDNFEQNAVNPWTDVDGWVDRCQRWRSTYPVVSDEHRERSATISTYHFAEVVSKALSSDDVLALGCSGLAIEIFIFAMRLQSGQRAIFNNALGEMGAGPPTALGACIGSGGRRTICVDGDGGLQLNVQELETIRRLQLPIKIFVLSNDGYASIRSSQNRWFGRLIGADASSGVTLPPLEGIAAAYGLTFVTLDGMTPLDQQVKTVLDMPGPVLCEVPTPRDEPRQPVQISIALPDGGIQSLPLEDLSPRLSQDELAANML